MALVAWGSAWIHRAQWIHRTSLTLLRRCSPRLHAEALPARGRDDSWSQYAWAQNVLRFLCPGILPYYLGFRRVSRIGPSSFAVVTLFFSFVILDLIRPGPVDARGRHILVSARVRGLWTGVFLYPEIVCALWLCYLVVTDIIMDKKRVETTRPNLYYSNKHP